MLFILNNALVIDVAEACAIGGTAAGLVSISDVLNVSDIMQFLDYDKSSFISQLIEYKSRDLQKLLKNYVTKTSVPNVLLSIVVFTIAFFLHSKYLLVAVLLLSAL